VSLSSFGVRKPVVVNLYVFGMIVGGIVFGSGLRREFFPQVNPTMVVVTAPYPGAAPDEVEKSLATKIEDRLADLRDIKEMTTIVTEGMARIQIEFNEGVAIDRKVADVKREVDSLQDLPERAERIVVDSFEPNIPVISLNLYGDADERAMKDAVRRMQDDLRSLPGMGQIRVAGVRGDELSVEVRPEALLMHGLSLPQVADKVRQAMIELPGGSVRSPTASVTVRTMGAQERAAAVRAIVVKAGGDGQVLRVGDLAQVREGFVDVDVLTRFNGRPSMGLTVYKEGDQDAVDIAGMVKAYMAGRLREPFIPTPMERLSGSMRRPGDVSPVSARQRAYELGLSRPPPPGEVAVSSDLSRFISQRLELLSRNAAVGASFVFLTLLLLLNWRSAFWVVLGLVVAVLGTLVLMRIVGITLNLLTMFGLIVVVGMLVDDGIVVAENITSRHDRGEPPMEAAIKGAEEVGWPVVGTVLTTIFAFLPLMLIQGQIGDMLGALPMVVTCALSVSLVEALLSLPKHMGHSLKRTEERHAAGRVGWVERIEERFDRARDHVFDRYIFRGYRWLSGVALSRPWTTLAVTVAVLAVSLGMIAGGRLGFVFFETDDTETLLADLRMPVGTPVERTDAVLRRIERAALVQPEVKSVFVLAGAQANLEGGAATSQGHLGQVFIELTPVEARQAAGQRAGDAIKTAIRQAAGDLTGVKSLRLEGVEGGPGGPAISLAVFGDSVRAVSKVVRQVESVLAGFDGVYDVANDADAGQRELRLTLKPGASELGFTTENVARQVRGALYGLEAHTFAGLREDVDVRVRFPESDRRTLAGIEQMHLFTPDGSAVPLMEVVRLEEAEGYATVRRLNRRRVVTVSCEVDKAVTTAEQLMPEVWRQLEAVQLATPGVTIVERGRQKEMQESFATLPLGMLVALGLNYVVLAWLFGSYVQPVLVMTAIPLAVIGMVWGHLVMGYNLTFLSLIGFVALSGVVVNNSLVYIEFYNQKRREGLGAVEAAMQAGLARLRPILLTTITTVAGLGPLVLERSFQARILIPMAITICYGLLCSSALVLVVVPSLLVVVDRVKRLLATAWTGRRPEPEGLSAEV
jgi:HAE1 family hydrophobic/amphiphilic exporter-1